MIDRVRRRSAATTSPARRRCSVRSPGRLPCRYADRPRARAFHRTGRIVAVLFVNGEARPSCAFFAAVKGKVGAQMPYFGTALSRRPKSSTPPERRDQPRIVRPGLEHYLHRHLTRDALGSPQQLADGTSPSPPRSWPASRSSSLTTPLAVVKVVSRMFVGRGSVASLRIHPRDELRRTRLVPGPGFGRRSNGWSKRGQHSQFDGTFPRDQGRGRESPISA